MRISDKLLHGMYVLTTKDSGCMVDAVCQLTSGDNMLVSVCVNKNNYTNLKIKENRAFALSVFGLDNNPAIIENFGFHSSKDYEKFAKFDYLNIDGIKVLSECAGYLVCDVVDIIEVDTHTMFIGKVKTSKVLNENSKPMSYLYYKEHKDNLLKVITDNGKTAWVCTVCGYVYYGENLPDDFKCPVCGVDKSLFIKK